MTQKYFAILTQYGAAQIAAATAQKKTIHIEKMAVGDGAGKDTVPNDKQTKLIKENYRSALNSLKSEAGKNTIIAELIIKETTGGWWIREMGLYDDKGGLVAVANCPASYKPQLAEGSGKVQTLRMVFVVSNTAAVTISASNDIGIASIELVEDTMKKHIADDDPHSKDYYNKTITNKTNADLKKELTAAAVKEGSRGRDEAKKYADDNKVALTGNQSIAGNKTFTGDIVAKKITAKEDVVSENSFIALRNNAQYAPSVTLSNKALTKAITDALPNGNSAQAAAYLAYAADTETSALRKVGSLEFRVDKEGLTRSMWSVNHRDGTSGVAVLGKASCSFPVPISAPDPTQTANDSFKVSSKWVNEKLKPYRKGMQPMPATSDLNDYVSEGRWLQPSNTAAKAGKNYPAPIAGELEVSATGTTAIQRYTLYTDSTVFTRTRYAGSWRAWAKVATDLRGTAYDAARLGGKLAATFAPIANPEFIGLVKAPNIEASAELKTGYRLMIDRNQAPFAPYVTMNNRAATLAALNTLANGAMLDVGNVNYTAVDTPDVTARTVSTTVASIDKKGDARLYADARNRDGKKGATTLTATSFDVTVPITAPDPVASANDAVKVSSKWVNTKLLPYYKELPPISSDSDLNHYIEDGYVFQGTNLNATAGKNYPVGISGVLEVKANGTTQIYQKYTTYDKSEQFTRTRYNSVWSQWVKAVNEQSGVATDSQKLGGMPANRYPTFADLGGKGLALEGCVNANAKGQLSNAIENDWTQGAFHNGNQPTALDNKTAWLASMTTQYSQGYSVISKIGTYRSGWMSGASMVFQMTGEANAPLGTWEMRSDGTFLSKNVVLNRPTTKEDYSKLVFEKKYPSANKQILGAITWDSFRDVSAVSNVAAIWAEGAGTAANWGELHFGVTTNGSGDLPAKIMSISDGRVLTSQLHTYHLKSRDPAGSIADKARDYDGVSSLLRWQHYGNGHVIFDASSGHSPLGKDIGKINARVGWSPGYPVLMGSNGVDTFGVRVDAARYAEGMADGSFGVPVGIPQPWPSNTPPTGWIFLQGQSINAAEAPILASLYGATLPDLRGMYISGWDAGRGIDPGRTVLSYQAANVGEHQHTVPFDDGGWLSYSGGGGQPGVNYVIARARTTTGGPQGRTRPDNIAFNYIVRWG